MFYKLKLDNRIETIGKPTWQIDRLEWHEPYESREHRDVKYMDDFDKYDFQLEYFLLEKGAILTDLLGSFGASKSVSRMMSKELYTVLKEFNIPEHDFFPCTVKRKSTGELFYNYGVLRLRIVGAEIYANYDNSQFVLRESVYKEPKPLEIGSFQELIDDYKIYRLGESRRAEPLVFDSDFKLDIINLRTTVDWYVSVKLRDRLIYEGFTGLQFEKEPNIVVL